MKFKFYSLIILFAFLISVSVQAQLFIDNSYTAEEMVMDFFDNSCVSPSNIIHIGSMDAFSFFDAGNTDLGAQAGIFLSTGNVFEAIGPNDAGGTSGNNGATGDTELENLLMGMQSFDASTLEMDIVATGDQLEFSYVFASEEYLEFVNSSFNDIFAFFISGPGINGLQNIAMVPNSSDPVSINTINNIQNATYFYDNVGGQDIEFDGFTTALTAAVSVTPNETYHIKITIADVGDSAFDSGIFLGVTSLCGEEELTPPAILGNISVDDMTITLQNNSKYATAFLWNFGDGNTSTEKNPVPHTYAVDGNYEISLITYNYCCSDTVTQEVTIGNPTGVRDLAVKPYQFSPNPVNDLAQIRFENGEDFEWLLFDAAGKLMAQKAENGSAEIEMGTYAPGVYFMEVRVEGVIYRDKVLKF